MNNKMTRNLPASPLRAKSGARIRTRSAGFTLIEILIAMLVLAIGLMGIAAMQFRGLQYSHDAYLRSQISVLAYSMADRMRLNRANVASYTAGTPYIIPATQPGGCTESSVGATNDLACWHREVHNAIPPGGIANIVAEANGGYTIVLGWSDRERRRRQVDYTFLP